MTAARDQLGSEVVNFRADGGIVDGVADADLQAAQQGGVHVQIQNRLQMKICSNRGLDARLVFVGQGHGRKDRDMHAVGAVVIKLVYGSANRAAQVEAIVIVEDQEELVDHLASPARKRLLDRFLASFASYG